MLPHRAQQILKDPENPRSEVDPSLAEQAAADAHVERQIQIKPVNVELEEDGVRIALTVVDTPGFGEGIDNEHWCVGERGSKREPFWGIPLVLTSQLPGDRYLP